MQFLEVEYCRIVEAPLDDVRRLNQGRLARRLAGADNALLPAPELQRVSLQLAHNHFAFDDAQFACAIFVGDFQRELGPASNRPAQGRLQLKLVWSVPAEEIEKASEQFDPPPGSGLSDSQGAAFGHADRLQFRETNDRLAAVIGS